MLDKVDVLIIGPGASGAATAACDATRSQSGTSRDPGSRYAKPPRRGGIAPSEVVHPIRMTEMGSLPCEAPQIRCSNRKKPHCCTT